MQGRTALDLLSAELKVFMEHKQGGVVFSWGDGGNYQLGTGATGLQAAPVRLDALRKQLVVQIAAAKFHSAAVTKDGQLFTWGFGRGGRLGGFSFRSSQLAWQHDRHRTSRNTCIITHHPRILSGPILKSSQVYLS